MTRRADPGPAADHVVVAPHSFGGSLDAAAVARHVTAGVHRVRPGSTSGRRPSPPRAAARRPAGSAAGLAGAWALTDLEPDVVRCLAQAPRLLEETGARLARQWWPGPDGPAARP